MDGLDIIEKQEQERNELQKRKLRRQNLAELNTHLLELLTHDKPKHTFKFGIYISGKPKLQSQRHYRNAMHTNS